MSPGAVVAIDTQQLLRAVCGVAFGRARMSAVYRYLRGVDPTTGEADTAGTNKTLGRNSTMRRRSAWSPRRGATTCFAYSIAGFVSQMLDRLQERDRKCLCLLHPRAEGRRSKEQTRRDDRALGVRNVAYGTLLRSVRDGLRTRLGAGCAD